MGVGGILLCFNLSTQLVLKISKYLKVRPMIVELKRDVYACTGGIDIIECFSLGLGEWVLSAL